ncbi:MAG: SRPBCC family protein [Deltaproteobacteria bacterium]|nr:SRPBCC family protein [Deltaproteobacteria bacterium]
MKLRARHPALALALSCPPALASPPSLRAGLESPSGWTEVDRKTVDGVGEVIVRHKQIDGEDCLEGSTVATLDPDALLAAASDVEAQPKWSSWKVAAAKKLTGGSGSFDYYQLLDNPGPVADRYWFVRATTGMSGDDRYFKWDQVDAATAYPAEMEALVTRFPGAVPTRTNVGDWTFSPGATGTTIRYRICTDAGGNLPRWVGEIAARSTLPTNVADIVREVKRRGG